jgi:hypothetical protein
MVMLYRDTEHSNVIAIEFPGPDADVRDNRDCFDAVCEVPHRFHPADRMVMSWACGFAVAVLLMAAKGWLS